MKNITIGFPEEALKALIEGREWKGKVDISIPPAPGKERLKNINQRQRKLENAKFWKLSTEEKAIFDSWNNGTKKLDRQSEKRNYETSLKDFQDNFRTIRLAIERMGKCYILEQMEIYFHACSNDEHIWDGLNHGFKNVIGFLSKLNSIFRNKEKPWWDNKSLLRPFKDSHQELTQDIAQEFYTIFMDNPSFKLINPSPEYRAFSKAGDRMLKFFDSNRRLPFSKKEFIDYLMKALKIHSEQVNSKVIYPGNLSSNSLWNVVLPQYINNIWTGSSFNWNIGETNG